MPEYFHAMLLRSKPFLRYDESENESMFFSLVMDQPSYNYLIIIYIYNYQSLNDDGQMLPVSGCQGDEAAVARQHSKTTPMSQVKPTR